MSKPTAAALSLSKQLSNRFLVGLYDDLTRDDVAKQIDAEYAPLVEAAELTVLHFRRNQASGNFQGDDEHEAWSALFAALAKVKEGK